MKVTKTDFQGLLIIEPRVFDDQRGYFYEVHQHERYAEAGIPAFVQDNLSRSKRGVLRGMHYQLSHSQGKLVGVTSGEVWDVAVDLRRSSPTFGKWFARTLSDKNHTQIYIPPGFAHGFCVLSETADFYYKCTDYYDASAERGIIWNDTQLKIDWPIAQPTLAAKDTTHPSLNEISHEQLFA
jgi:dTDP-4-dehydrorhamnose 3,5-epimerase